MVSRVHTVAFHGIDVLDIDVERALLALSPGALQQCRSVGVACDPAFPSALLRHLSAGRPATALAADVDRQLDAGRITHAYLIRGHGLYTWARDMSGCLRQVEALDFLFDCELMMRRTR